MEMHQHGMAELFQQLGLGSSPQEIKDFINEHRHKRASAPLYEASFWTSSQATFLKQAIEEDADWAELVDQLDVMLRD
ncbi:MULTISPECIES: DUF2789 domain-containing protein [Vibrio]|uniref:DUF2789 domain-containing protein n=1 Tax=Vibrio TaxID=662 RepID=UPI00062E4483|nr:MULTISPECIES: DUF2789 domain-containing protein [Vibrio]KLE25002.1 hypothetical protein AAW52_08315 [Vibrio diabolicus]MCS0311319.1 DUF2789 domain-containing protein [Vibrio diabolicus]MCS0370510.1 DUF2789 domain-containing protein [Vibrio diabolicus]MCZ0759634.1 DUF2789 domain-containing protein [Vibrio diabolicus]MDV5058228.1 DUF2789 domain-containing protein [Vibrio diabolicus]